MSPPPEPPNRAAGEHSTQPGQSSRPSNQEAGSPECDHGADLDSRSADFSESCISLRGVRQHNLKGFDLDLPLGRFTVVTGPSGSGKSSLAFHTLYAEGQRRYVETFSPYVRQFFDRMDKPAVDEILGIPPAIAIEQKNTIRNSRSTVGTLSEINDYLKVLFARMARGYDPETGEEITPDSAESIWQQLLSQHEGAQVLILFPVTLPESLPTSEVLAMLQAQGYLRILHEGKVVRVDDELDEPELAWASPAYVVQDRVAVAPERKVRALESLEAALHSGKGHCAIRVIEPSEVPASKHQALKHFTSRWTNPATGTELRPPTASLFTFNSPLGACPKCRGFGKTIGLDLSLAIPDHGLSLRGGAIRAFQGERGEECQRDLLWAARETGVEVDVPFRDLPPEHQHWVINGTGQDPQQAWEEGHWYGVKGFFDWLESKSYKMHVRVFLSRYRAYTDCAHCHGTRLQPEALCYQIQGKTLPDLWQEPIQELHQWIEQLTDKPRDKSGELAYREVRNRLGYLCQVGLGYLTLDREARTLSGGEIERVNLTSCLGSSLSQTLFVLDEPTVGLHPRDVQALIRVMHDLRDQDNTVLVVEHEEAVMRAADHLLDLGPASGEQGGELTYQGPPDNTQTRSLTLDYLNGRRSLARNEEVHPPRSWLHLRGASHHNLHQLDLDLPLGVLCCITGVSGSGKSTLVHHLLYPHLAQSLGQEATSSDPQAPKAGQLHQIFATDAQGQATEISSLLHEVHRIDQSPLSRTPRSTPAVFLKAFDPIRQLFAQTPEAKADQRTTGYFSFNSGGGRCERCAGNGFEKIEMQFLSDIYLTCPECHGTRYTPQALQYRLHGHTIADILHLTVEDALTFFRDQDNLPAPTRKRHAQIRHALQPLQQVGLGYLRLGQPLNTLSGGEAQRLKLCQLLIESQKNSPRSQGRSPNKPRLLILDEPTTGLHFSDLENLLATFQSLLSQGHSIIVVEHNLDLIDRADWVIDLGPEAGPHGGQVVATGSPHQLREQASQTNSHTAKHLRLHRKETAGK